MSQRSSAAFLTAMALALPVFAGLPARAVSSDVLKNQTVQIRVYREDAEPDYGSGVILCQREELAYILTAHHVLYGTAQGGGRKLSRRDVRKTEISFHRELAATIVEDRDQGEDRISVSPVPAKDLVLLTVAVPTRLPNAAPGRIPPNADLTAEAGLHGFLVMAVGYAQENAKGWVERTGAMSRREDMFLMHTAQIEKGFSGGPLFDESGALVGLNVRYASTAATGEDHFGGREGLTLAIDEIINSIDGWLPAGCIQSVVEDTSEREAFDIYKQAIREIGLKRWGKAAPLLKSALEKKPQEGGRVHLQGMHFTEYLPHYHLGLAYYKLGLYRDAHRELTISETQGVVREDKRYRKLKRYKQEAYEKRNEEPSPIAP